jgi:spore cortex biosynthesis protein YabQ
VEGCLGNNMAAQYLYVISLLIAGIVMGTVFDIYNTVTGASKWLRWLRPTLDILFWIGSALLVYYTLYVTDSGRLRIYVFGIIAVGYFFYRMTFRARVIRSAFIVVRIIETTGKIIYNVVYTLTIRPIIVIWTLMMTLVKQTYGAICKVEDVLIAMIRFIIRFSIVPLVNKLPYSKQIQRQVHRRWEDLWKLLSKWLTRRIGSA